MAITITKIAELKRYLNEMIKVGRVDDSYPRADHAPKVREAVLAVAGNLVMTADDNSIELAQRTRQSGVVHEVNTVRFAVGGLPYVVVYSTKVKKIVIRRASLQGVDVARIDNTSTQAQIMAIFASL